MSRTSVHIINHTHWDREWFLTSVYTSQWIPGLIDKLEQLATLNPDFRFFLDGQTLVIEDLLQIAEDYKAKVDKLVTNGNLTIGPYYCQPDWRLTGGEALIRHLLYGQSDVTRHGGNSDTGWLVDTFGHISQAPQLHLLFGVEAVYVWRGVPQLEPYFYWRGADGGELFTINLFGGYRNLYGVTHVPEVAIRRLQAEVTKLQPFYPTADIPLFDGYDLEDNPEDPLRFFQQQPTPIPDGLELQESTPGAFARSISQKLPDLPAIWGELNSGKYAATFPGTLSTRTYLKMMKRDCEHLLYQVCEPLAVLARFQGRAYDAHRYETWGRTLLQNAVHDCICGVSIDPVHEKMELSYHKTFDAVKADICTSLAYILRDFAPGTYAVSTNPFAFDGWQMAKDKLYLIKTDGIGLWPIGQGISIETLNEPIETFEWHNDHYAASVGADGVVQMGEAALGFLVVSEEKGDCYSNELGPRRGDCRSTEPLVIEQQSDVHSVLRFRCDLFWENAHISAVVRLIFDQTPLIRWQIDLDSRGTDFRVDMVFATDQPGHVYAGMPFDVVKRPTVDRDLLPRQPEQKLAEVLLGQRELEMVRTFPFHDFVALSDGTSCAVVLAKGVHAYQADDRGRISIALRRSVEWLTKPDLEYRVGDAGPVFYVPDARCERTVRHELAVLTGHFGADEWTVHRFNAGFQNPPFIVESPGDGPRTEWQFLQEDLALSSLYLQNRQVLARFYNPTTKTTALHGAYVKTDVWGNLTTPVAAVHPKNILTVALEQPLPPLKALSDEKVVELVDQPTWRVGENHGLPDPEIIERINRQITQLEHRLEETEEQLNQAVADDGYLLQHRYYVLKRELYELRLCAQLNAQKLAAQGRPSDEYLYTLNEQVAELGLRLNQLRIKRRIFDYVVQAVKI